MKPDAPCLAPTALDQIGDMPPEQFRQFGYQIVDWITKYMQDMDTYPVLSPVQPGFLRSQLPDTIPQHGQPFEEILADVDRYIMPGVTHWNHPSFFAYFTTSSSGPGILGEMLMAALNPNCMLWKSCPSATELEQVTLNWLRQMLGLPEEYWGIIYDGASSSNLHGIAAAREQIAGANIREKGMAGRADLPKLRIYFTDQAHSSVDKAVIVLGLGLESIRRIPVDDGFRMRPEALAAAIEEDRREGWLPFCVVANIGSTSCTSSDPISDLADICERENLWLHVDSAHGGALALLPEKRDLFAGWERADSIVFNPHKWLFVPMDLSTLFTRKPDVLQQAFSLVAEYLRTSEGSEVENYMDYGVALGRRFRALKLWFVFRYFGLEGLINRVRFHLELTREVTSWIDEHPDFERLAPVPMTTVCFRAHPLQIDDEKRLDTLNEALMEAANRTGEMFLTHTKLNGKMTLRFVVSHLRTERRHVVRGWEILQEKLKELTENEE